jgi:hypothetical protein
MAIQKRLRNYFFQSTVEKSPRGKSVRFLKDSDPNEDTFRNWAASFVNFLEDFATTTVAGIFSRATTTEVQNRTRTRTIDGVAYPLAVDPDQVPTIIAGTNVSVSSAMNGNRREYTVNVPASGSALVTTDATLAGDGTVGTPLKIAQQAATDPSLLKWNGTTWVPLAIIGENIITDSGNIAGTFWSWDGADSEWGLSGTDSGGLAPVNGDTLTWDSINERWRATTPSNSEVEAAVDALSVDSTNENTANTSSVTSETLRLFSNGNRVTLTGRIQVLIGTNGSCIIRNVPSGLRPSVAKMGSNPEIRIPHSTVNETGYLRLQVLTDVAPAFGDTGDIVLASANTFWDYTGAAQTLDGDTITVVINFTWAI